ncbi:hypothetical protein PRZ48_001141 [Zasmidium cellare]|uniref:DUF300-domain-containing protein n=1 Tax=Zasmidium cellare TaxID=395010 RepID=A0ABR0F0H5_ZASCE|nr:hypothetical protein PRZ48_001141 [Zasmidium cellare]
MDYGERGSAHKPMLYVAGAGTAVTFLISLALIFNHLRRYRCPKEQRQIIRLVFAPFVFAIVSFFEVLSYDAAPYLDPLGDFYEAFCLCALFLLYFQFAVPGGTFDNDTFEAVKAAEEGKALNVDWPRITWVFVFQYPLTELVALIILEATQAAGRYCVQSLNPKYGHIWYTIIQSIGVGACVLAILRFHGHMKNRMKVRRGLAKLVCFKLIVFLRFIQSTVFSILLDHNVIKASDTFTYDDILYGLENCITCVEMAILAIGFWYAYSATEYSSRARPQHDRLPVHRAILNALNPWDLLAGIGRLFSIVLHLRRTGGFQDWAAARKAGKAEKKAGNPQQRREQGRYQTLDGMELLSRPNAAYDGASSQFNDTTYSNGQALYQPPSGSPPSYVDQSGNYLMADSRRERSPSPNGRVWDGQRYDRTPSPSGRFVEGRDMV